MILPIPSLNSLLRIHPRWIPSLLLVPCLYAAGWLTAQLFTMFGLAETNVSPLGTLFSFVLFLALLPRWGKIRWQSKHPWRTLGISGGGRDGRPRLAGVLCQGLLWALLLLGVIVLPILIGSWGHWLGECSLPKLLNGILLIASVGFAEELIFRGWLFEELQSQFGTTWGIWGQALVFSLVHTRFNLGIIPMLSLLVGLLLLGLLLAMRRAQDRGSLWGCVGLHGGLVGGWFLLEAGLLQLSPTTPAWLVGPGGLQPNPLGSGVAITALLVMLLRSNNNNWAKTIHTVMHGFSKKH